MVYTALFEKIARSDETATRAIASIGVTYGALRIIRLLPSSACIATPVEHFGLRLNFAQLRRLSDGDLTA